MVTFVVIALLVLIAVASVFGSDVASSLLVIALGAGLVLLAFAAAACVMAAIAFVVGLALL